MNKINIKIVWFIGFLARPSIHGAESRESCKRKWHHTSWWGDIGFWWRHFKRWDEKFDSFYQNISIYKTNKIRISFPGVDSLGWSDSSQFTAFWKYVQEYVIEVRNRTFTIVLSCAVRFLHRCTKRNSEKIIVHNEIPLRCRLSTNTLSS